MLVSPLLLLSFLHVFLGIGMGWEIFPDEQVCHPSFSMLTVAVIRMKKKLKNSELVSSPLQLRLCDWTAAQTMAINDCSGAADEKVI